MASPPPTAPPSPETVVVERCESAAPPPVAAPPPAQGLLLTLFVQYLLPVIATGLSALLGWGMKLGLDWLKAKGETSKAAHVGAVFAEGAASVVVHLEATMKAELLEASKDGVISPEEGARLKSVALAELKKLPAPMLAAAASLFGGGLDTWLSGLVERAVTAQKPAAPSFVPSAPEPAPTRP